MILIAMLLPVGAYPAGALSVVKPLQVVVSENGNWIVRISSVAMGRESSMAQWYQLRGVRQYALVSDAALRNEVSPQMAFVSNEGALATVGDVSGDPNLAIALYGSSGKFSKSWSLNEIFSLEELKCIQLMTGVSTNWIFWSRSADALGYFGSTEVVSLKDLLGGVIEIDLKRSSVRVFSGGRAAEMKRTKCSRLR